MHPMIPNKKLLSLLSVFILLVIAFSGCLGSPSHNENQQYKNIIKNKKPVAAIDVPEQAYIGDEITFDASKSYDPDGTIVSYSWDFGDGSTAKGKVVKHAYSPKEMMAPEYPLFVPVTLTVEDDKGAFDWQTFTISLMPKNYVFYLSEGSLVMDKPSEGSTAVKAGMGLMRPKAEIVYNLDTPIVLPTCAWNVTIYIEKSRFAVLSGLSVIALGENGSEIASLDSTAGILGGIGKTSVTYQLSGSFPEGLFSGIKIIVKGFSLRSSIRLMYGGEKASVICFDLT
ncbi:MAG: hypothetical protein DRJ99_01870 [Thermoplasmata archaeon]|nr:MAG: hypothetical protein DRJ99_01870 [Thermoplasmata archaeon]